MVPQHVSDFRTKYREAEISAGYSGWRHFWITTIASLAVIAFAISRVRSPSLAELCAVPVFFLVANLGEYFGHRGPMHHRRPGLYLVFQRHTLQHHQFYTHDAMEADSPRDYKMVLFPPVMLVFFLGLMAAPIGLALGVLVSPNLGWLFVATGVGYFLTYEWLHFSYHQPVASRIGGLALVRRLRQHHLIHHDLSRMASTNFNITFPIADTLFGTNARD